MMNIFITGATGYIGSRVARILRGAGQAVWGMTRNPEKANILAQYEINPVIADMNNPASYLPVAKKCQVLIHTAKDPEHDTAELDKKTVQTLITASGKADDKKMLIYTSGVWVYGNTQGKIVDEKSQLKPISMVSWRPQVEAMVLQSQDIDGIVLRPGCVYGKEGGMTGFWFQGAAPDNDFQVVGDGSNHWAMVHVDDLAKAYLAAVERNPRGEIFNITDGERPTVKEMVQNVARANGYQGDINFSSLKEAKKEMGDFAEALAIDQIVDNRKAHRLLHWTPQHKGFIDQIAFYSMAWKAFHRVEEKTLMTY
jgi:nucleoside-diphosphate-sugar epimerase